MARQLLWLPLYALFRYYTFPSPPFPRHHPPSNPSSECQRGACCGWLRISRSPATNRREDDDAEEEGQGGRLSSWVWVFCGLFTGYPTGRGATKEYDRLGITLYSLSTTSFLRLCTPPTQRVSECGTNRSTPPVRRQWWW